MISVLAILHIYSWSVAVQDNSRFELRLFDNLLEKFNFQENLCKLFLLIYLIFDYF